jgi:hypothetical protein
MNARNIGRGFAYAAISIATWLCLSAPAGAVYVSIDDLTDTLSVATDANVTSQTIVQEGIGIMGQVNLAFDFVSEDPAVPPPLSKLFYNYAIYEPNSPRPTLSDILLIDLIGLDPSTNDSNNVRVTISFRSDSADERGLFKIPPGAQTIFETGEFQSVYAGLSDLTVQFRSDVSETPLPTALPLFSAGLGALGLLGWRRKRKVKLVA